VSIALSISGRNRARKWDLFLEEMKPGPETRVLDVGFSGTDWSPVENYIEKHYPYPGQLTALGVDKADEFRRLYPQLKVVEYDGGVFPFSDGQFDVCWSNAVIEHVGDESRQVLFLKEIRRVARRAFVTTPNRLFPVEVHTRMPLVHYLPKRAADACLVMAGRRWATGDYMRLLTIGRIRRLLAAAGIDDYRIERNRLCGLTLDFVIMFGS